MAEPVASRPEAGDVGDLLEIGAIVARAAQLIDGRFVLAGETLGDAYAAVERLAGSLLSLGAMLEAPAIGEAVGRLEAGAAELAALPAVQKGRHQALKAARAASATLCIDFAEIRQLLGLLRFYGMNIKITAAGAAELGDFSDKMASQLTVGETQLASFEKNLSLLSDLVADMLRSEEALAGESRRLVPAVPVMLAQGSAVLRDQQARLAALVRDTARAAEGARSELADALGAIQIGDITRQRLEHVALALTRLADEPAGNRDKAAAEQVMALLLAQVTDAAGDFRRDCQRLTRSVRGLAGSASRLTELRASSDSDAVLQELEGGVGSAEALTGRLRDASARVDVMKAMAVDATGDLTRQVALLRGVRADVQQMALNAGLRSRRMANQGRPIAVVASEIRHCAGKLDDNADRLVTGVESLSGAITGLCADSDGEAGQGLATLQDVVLVVREASDRTQHAFAAAAREAAGIAELVDRALTSLDCDTAVMQVVDDALAAMASMASAEGVHASPSPSADRLLALVARGYTMDAERRLHARFRPLATDGRAAAPTAGSDDDDDLADVLF